MPPETPPLQRDNFARDRLPSREQWPDLLFELPELQAMGDLNCATRLIDDAIAEGHGERIAIITNTHMLTYSELLQQSNKIANVLVGLGVIPGNRVLLRGYNDSTLVAAWLAVMKVGGIAVTTMPMLRASELIGMVAKARIEYALCDHRLAEELQVTAAATGLLACIVTWADGDLEQRVAAAAGTFQNVVTSCEDICLIAFTSGTTGTPKATVHFHRDVLAMAEIVGGRLLHPSPDDIFIGSPPLGFTFGLGALLVFPLRFRAAVGLLEQGSPEALLDAVQRWRATYLFTAPTAYRSMLSHLEAFDVSSLRCCVSAGEPLPLVTSDAWFEHTGMRLIDGIGATEMIHIFISASGEDIRPGATGKPLPGYRACVLDDDGAVLPRGSTGRLAVKGPTGCRYLDDDRQKVYVQDGWNITGDTYRVDEDGYFWFQARADDIILSAGYNIAGPEVEWAVMAHAAVQESAVIGVPDAERGQLVKAFVVLQRGHVAAPALAREIQDFVKQRIAPYKYPRIVEFVDALPKTQTGKVQRFALRHPTLNLPKFIP